MGPTATRAMRLPVAGSKRRKVLVVIAAYADAGVPNPSISQIVSRTKLPRPAVVGLVDLLEHDGLLEIHRSPGVRNRYRVKGAS